MTGSNTAVRAFVMSLKSGEVGEMSYSKQTRDRGIARRVRRDRRGTACVELAVLSPLLLIFILGIIDVGQFVNVGQSVSNASREGARVAARSATVNVAAVEAAVKNYLTDMHPNLPSSAVQVTVSSGGNPVAGTGLASVAMGSTISVQVDVQFDAVRWFNGLTFLNGRTVTRTTFSRRE